MPELSRHVGARGLVRVALASLAACSSSSPPIANTAPAPAPAETIAVHGFGALAIARDDFAIIDRGSGDGRVHLIVVTGDRATKTSWDDKPGQSGRRSEALTLSDDERGEIRSWRAELWPIGPKSYVPSPESPYRWAVIMRRDGETHVIDGGASGADSQPDIIESIVDFLDMHF